ncbi:MAG: ABC transporter ATP-binding protein [Clostridia bacterium]|nr:ABC transporter ATP-binding protein [Clostridia bacterium]
MSNLKKAASIFRSPAIRAIYRWSKPVHGAIVAISVISVASTLLSLGVTLVTKNLIDGATSGKADLLWKYGIALVALIVTERVLSVTVAWIRNKSNARLQMEMQRMVTSSLMGKDYAAIKPYHSGELVNRVFSDVGVVKGGVMNLVPSILRITVSFIGAAVILIDMDWRFLPVIILASLLGLVITAAFKDPMKRRHKRMQEAEDTLHASTQETLENIRVVKASVSEDRAMNQMDTHRGRLVTEQLRNGRLSIWMQNGMGSVFDISWLVCNLWGCVKIYQNTGFTYGSLAALIQLVGRIQAPIANAVQLVSQAYGVVSSAERLMEIIDLPEEDQGTELTSFDAIKLQNVSFQYDDGVEEVLLELDATINKGDFVALTGMSGGGKTSLFQLLLGIYRPTNGQVLFTSEGQEYRASRGTRSLFAYVPQGNTLMSGTLRDNITMFTDHATDEQVERAIHAACLDDLVAEVGYDARLGERGIGLSEGQAQRVAIARALLSDAPILLLDEATSALDEQTEAKLLQNIDAMRDKTVIIVTHRRAALAICDYQLHIEDGRMTRIGTNQRVTV